MSQAFLMGQNGGYYGTLSTQVSGFAAAPGNAQVSLSWTNPTDSNFAGVLIVRKAGSYPLRVSNGTKIYRGAGTSFIDTGLTNDTQYYYRAFAYNSKREYQTIYCVATAMPRDSQPLGSMPIGAKIKFGSIYGGPIVQTIANKSGNDITLITNGIIMTGSFDASENTPITERAQYGYAEYASSNINQWLNSEAEAGKWYAPLHSGDQAPDSNHVKGGYPYDTAAGFLNGFSSKEKSYLKTQTITVEKMDRSGTEVLDAHIWLPSVTEVGLTIGFTEGSPLSLFSDNNSRIAKYTANCVSHCYGTVGTAGDYWLRTPNNRNYLSIVEAVRPDGGETYDNASDSEAGIRPCCCLDASTLISSYPDSDGCYTLV